MANYLLRRSLTQGPDPSVHLYYEHVTHLNQFEVSMRLLYETYQRQRFIPPNHIGMWLTQHHLLASTRVYLARLTSLVVGTITAVEDGPLGLPMESAFGSEVNQIRRANGRAVEATCLSIRDHSLVSSLDVLSQLMALVAQSSQRGGATHILITVHPRHARFYRKTAGFRSLGPAKPYPTVGGKMAIPMAVEFSTMHEISPDIHHRYLGKTLPLNAVETKHVSKKTRTKLRAIWTSIQAELQRTGHNSYDTMRDNFAA